MISSISNSTLSCAQSTCSEKISVKTEEVSQQESQPDSHPETRPDVVSKLTRKQTIRKFFRSENGKKVYICFLESCSRQFNHLSSLIKHERIHRNERPYVCGTCGLSFIQSSNLKRHEKSHMGEKPYKCELCPKQFSTACNLRQHTQIHESCSGELKYACTKCGKSYIYTSSLIKHQKKCTESQAQTPAVTETETKEDAIRKVVKTEELIHPVETSVKLVTPDVCNTFLGKDNLGAVQTTRDKIISDLSDSVRIKQYPLINQSFSTGYLPQLSAPSLPTYPSYSPSVNIFSQGIHNAGSAANRLGFGFNEPSPLYPMQNRQSISIFNAEPATDSLLQAAIARRLLQQNLELRNSIQSCLIRNGQY